MMVHGKWTEERALPRPSRHGEPGTGALELFAGLGASLASVVQNATEQGQIGLNLSVSGMWTNLSNIASGTQLLPISETEQHRPAAAGSRLYTSKTRRPPDGEASSASGSPLPSSRSLATTVARFGGATDSYKVSRPEAPPNIRRSSLQASTDGLIKMPKAPDLCDKATRSKIDRWMSQAAVQYPEPRAKISVDQWFSAPFASASTAEASRPLTPFGF